MHFLVLASQWQAGINGQKNNFQKFHAPWYGEV